MPTTTTDSTYGDDYEWPTTLYEEMRGMAALSFFCYTFGYITHAARTYPEFKGLSCKENTKEGDRTIIKEGDHALKRSFTPIEVKELIRNNLDILKEVESSTFKSPDKVYGALNHFQDHVEKAGLQGKRALTLEEYDDLHQSTECVYAICKDDIAKRITVVFRGTETNSALGTNDLVTDVSTLKKKAALSDEAKKLLKGKRLRFHSGFFKYLFQETKDESDEKGTRKYDRILAEVQALVAKNPGHKVYVTGHSLGAALSSICALFFALEPDMPKPVTCINFASPRNGNFDVYEAVHELEKSKQLRMLRVVNDKDSITTVPYANYWHFGFQLELYDKSWFRGTYADPNITYFNPNDGFWTRVSKQSSNSIVGNLNLSYDHGEYIQRMNEVEEELGKTSLNDLYVKEKIFEN